MEEPGALDVGCRIDLLSIDLGSSGAQAPRPMSQFMLNASLGRESHDQTEAYLHGGPGEETRSCPVDLMSHGREITSRAETIGTHP